LEQEQREQRSRPPRGGVDASSSRVKRWGVPFAKASLVYHWRLRKGERRQSETGGGGIAVAREAGTVGRRS
jgi:hypothetical protein